jgi:hypothetical protein
MWRSRARRTRAALTVRVLPFVPQDDYDRLLWACDVNSCAARIPSCAPSGRQAFLWHIYIQDENLHHVKLRAFLQRYAVDAQGSIDSLVQAALAWNGATADPLPWGRLCPPCRPTCRASSRGRRNGRDGCRPWRSGK